MKVSSIITLCLLMSVVFSQDAPATPTGSCSTTDSTNKNYYVLKWLKAKGVTLLDTPKILDDKTVCGGEFNTAGTCCDLTSVKKFITDSNSGMAGKWGRYISKLARVRGKFMSGFKKITAKMNVNDIKTKMDSIKSNTKIVDKFKAAESILPATAQDVSDIKDFVSNFETEISTFKTQGKICFDALRAARANMFCAACSAKAATYTNTQTAAEAKFKIDYASCSTIVTKCYPVWKFNFRLNALMQYLNVNLSKKRGDSSKNSFKSEKEVTVSDLSSIRETFRNCKFATATATSLSCINTSTSVEDYTKGLCSKLFSVNNENGYVEGDETVDSDVTDDEVDTADSNVEPEKTESTPKTETVVAKRVLQSAATEPAATFDMGTAVDTTGTYNNLNADNTGVVPTESVTTASAGNTPNSAKIVTALGVVFAAFLVQFF